MNKKVSNMKTMSAKNRSYIPDIFTAKYDIPISPIPIRKHLGIHVLR
jgi:hypothetical protein